MVCCILYSPQGWLYISFSITKISEVCIDWILIFFSEGSKKLTLFAVAGTSLRLNSNVDFEIFFSVNTRMYLLMRIFPLINLRGGKFF